MLFKALSIGSQNAAIADQVAGSFITHVKEMVKAAGEKEEINIKVQGMFKEEKMRDQEMERICQEYMGG